MSEVTREVKREMHASIKKGLEGGNYIDNKRHGERMDIETDEQDSHTMVNAH